MLYCKTKSDKSHRHGPAYTARQVPNKGDLAFNPLVHGIKQSSQQRTTGQEEASCTPSAFEASGPGTHSNGRTIPGLLLRPLVKLHSKSVVHEASLVCTPAFPASGPRPDHEPLEIESALPISTMLGPLQIDSLMDGFHRTV